MKKTVSLILAFVMCMLPILSVHAFEVHTVYLPQEGCRLTEFKITRADNPWLLWDINFNTAGQQNILTVHKAHPNIVGCAVIPSITYEGDKIEFNGTELIPESSVTLYETNTLTIRTISGDTAEYIIRVTEETNGLPAVLINTAGAPIEKKTEYVDADISVLGADIYNAADIYNQPAQIKLRGNTTMGYDKKPYRIKFEKKQDVLGMGSAKSWVLLANYLDPSAIRNQAAFLFAEDLYEHTLKNSIYKNESQIAGTEEKYQVFSPRMKMVEVYVNGVFQGLYDMGDHMQANEIRIDIDESGDEYAKNPDGSEYRVNPQGNVGYFIEVEVGNRVIEEGAPTSEDWSAYSYVTSVGAAERNDGDDSIYTQWYIDKSGYEGKSIDALYFQFKLPENPSEEQIQYISAYLQEFSDKLLSDNPVTKESALKMIDMDSFINWYLINELFKNPDSQMQSSCYFYKDKDGVLYMAPVWDFDISAGAIVTSDMADPTGWRTRGDEYCGWFRELFEIKSFKDAVMKRWNDILNNGVLNNIFSNIEYLRSVGEKSATINADMWHAGYTETVAQSELAGNEISHISDYNTQLDYLKAFLKKRIHWMDGQKFEDAIPKLQTMYFDSTSDLIPTHTFYADGSWGSKTYDINMDIPTVLTTLYFSIESPSAFNVAMEIDVSYSIGGEMYTETVVASTGENWYTVPALASAYNMYGKSIQGGSFKNVPLPLMDVLGRYDGYGNGISRIFLKRVTVDYSDSAAGQPYTFLMSCGKFIDTDADGVEDYPDVLEKFLLSGAPVILGKAEVGNTLTVSSVSIMPNNAPVTYQWYKNNIPIPGAIGRQYTISESDAGAGITVRAKGTLLASGTLISQSVTVANPKVPVAQIYE